MPDTSRNTAKRLESPKKGIVGLSSTVYESKQFTNQAPQGHSFARAAASRKTEPAAAFGETQGDTTMETMSKVYTTPLRFTEHEPCTRCGDSGEVRWYEVGRDGRLEMFGCYCDCPAGKALYREHTTLDVNPDINP